MDNKNQPAFTKREYLAGLAMQSFISIKGLTTFDAVKNIEGVASDVVDASYAMADLMLNNK